MVPPSKMLLCEINAQFCNATQLDQPGAAVPAAFIFEAASTSQMRRMVSDR
jgi:hypothetical protein